MASIGTIIDNKYEIIAEIGKGGMSTVYLALDRRLNKQWAIKEAKKKPGEDSNVFELTPIAEANLLKSLDHPNIVRIVDIIEQGGYIYIVEDFVEGKSLSEEVKKGPCHPDDVINWGSQLCDVFNYIHGKNPPIIYRDMKPANVQLDTERKNVKLLDFGIAKTYKAQNTGDTTNLGTRGYAAPEQFDVNRQSDARTDIFSLGVTLRSLLMGKTPYDAEFYEDIRKQNPLVTDGLVKVINKATDQNPDKRYQTAADFKYALQHYHDSDAAVIRLRKRSINSFRAMLISAISLIMVGIMLFPLASLVQNNDFDAALASNDAKKCIEIKPTDMRGYELYLKDQQSSNNELATIKIKTDSINYTNIRNVDDRKKVALEAAYLTSRGSNDIMSSKNALTYYKDLANNFETENIEDIAVSTEFDNNDLSSEDMLVSIGKIMTYFYAVASASDNAGVDDVVNVQPIINNLKLINNFLNSNKQMLTSGVVAEVFAMYKNQKMNVNSFYDYLFEAECLCLVDSNIAENASAEDIEAVKDIIRAEQGNCDYVAKFQIDANIKKKN